MSSAARKRRDRLARKRRAAQHHARRREIARKVGNVISGAIAAVRAAADPAVPRLPVTPSFDLTIPLSMRSIINTDMT